MPYDEKPGIAMAIMKKAGKGKMMEEKMMKGKGEEDGISEEKEIAASEVMSAMKSGDEKGFAEALASFVHLCYEE